MFFRIISPLRNFSLGSRLNCSYSLESHLRTGWLIVVNMMSRGWLSWVACSTESERLIVRRALLLGWTMVSVRFAWDLRESGSAVGVEDDNSKQLWLDCSPSWVWDGEARPNHLGVFHWSSITRGKVLHKFEEESDETWPVDITLSERTSEVL